MASSLLAKSSRRRKHGPWQSTPPRRGSRRTSWRVGIGVRLVRNVDIIKVMKAAGFDWLFLDLEHGSMSIETACEIATAAQDSGIAPIVRVPYGELAMATRVLDGGALGIVIPHVDTAEEAREIADKLRYPPLGHRSVGGGQAQFDYAPMKMADMTKREQRQHADHGDDRDAQGGAQRRGDRGGARHRLPAGRLERPVDGDGHPRRERPSQDPGGRRQGHRRLQEAPQVPGHGRRLQRGAAAALHRQGHEAAAGRQRPADADQRRPHAPGEGAGDGRVRAKPKAVGEEARESTASLRSRSRSGAACRT